MDDQRLGAAVRAVRLRRGWRQEDLGARSGVSASVISRLERGHVETLTLATVRRIGACLDTRIDLAARWRGGDLDRMLAVRHATLAGVVVADLLGRERAVRPEVTFSTCGERGSIDLLAFRAGHGALLVVELKTELVDPHALIAQVDRHRRLAPDVASSIGWPPGVVGAWVVVGEGTVNRRRLAAHRTLLRAAFPADGRRIKGWLDEPAAPIAALSFRPIPPDRGGRRRARSGR